MFHHTRMRALVLLMAFWAPALLGESAEATRSDEAGLSADRLHRLDAILQGHIDRGELAGAVALVSRRGKIAHFEAMGRMAGDADDATPMRRDTLFGIASMTKPVTSTAVMMLFEEDRLRLDDPISKYFPMLGNLEVAVIEEGQEGPEAAYSRVPAARQITVLDLLRHTSGFTYDFMDPGPVGRLYREELVPDDRDTLSDFVEKLGTLPLTGHPGSAFSYGVSTDVLGALVEVVSGMRLGRFLDERIFRPLRMGDTAFYVSSDKAERLSTLYVVGEDGKVRPGVRPYFRGYAEPPKAPSGGGGLVSTASDYARFLQMFLNGGQLDGVRLLSRKSIELMTADHLAGTTTPRVAPGYGFGLGRGVCLGWHLQYGFLR